MSGSLPGAIRTTHLCSDAMKRIVGALVAASCLMVAIDATEASAPVASLSSAARATALARSARTLTDVVRVYQAGTLSLDVYARATNAAVLGSGSWAITRNVSVPMSRVMRGSVVVQQPEIAGFRFPMATTVLPAEAIAALMGRDVAAVVAQGRVVMAAITANQRGAKVGDTIDLEGAAGNIVTLTIGMLADDALVGGTELLLNTVQGDQLGIVDPGGIVIWGFPTRAGIDAGLVAQGLDPRADTRIRRSWDPFDPDYTLSTSETKVYFGEFAYKVRTNGFEVDVTPTWEATHLPAERELYPTGIRARCNNTVRADLLAALAEVVAAGLSDKIEVTNTNTYGGCYYPRFARYSGALGFLSRHSWGSPLDTNTVSNAQGSVPQMDCTVVRIFRKHNYAWGGNFLRADGMHFEWVGERRDLYQYPSKYCPNLPISTAQAEPTTLRTSRSMLFHDAGWSGDE